MTAITAFNATIVIETRHITTVIKACNVTTVITASNVTTIIEARYITTVFKACHVTVIKACPANCATCRDNGAGVPVCTKCVSGFALSKTGACQCL